MARSYHRAAATEKGKQAYTFPPLVPASCLRAAQLRACAEDLQSVGRHSVQGEHLLDSQTADEENIAATDSFKIARHRNIEIFKQGASGTDHRFTGKVYKGGQPHHLLSFRSDISVARRL